MPSPPAAAAAAAAGSRQKDKPHRLTDAERDSIDASTALLLRDLSSSIATLSSAEALRQETESTLLRRKYDHLGAAALWSWAISSEGAGAGRSDREQQRQRECETARVLRSMHDNVLWYLRWKLEAAADMQRALVEKRIERAREKERSVLYRKPSAAVSPGLDAARTATTAIPAQGPAASSGVVDEHDMAEIEVRLSPAQLQLFAEENDMMLRHYEDTLGKIQYVPPFGNLDWQRTDDRYRNAEKSLLEISSLQQTLVGHLASQEEYVSQLVGDSATTSTNIRQGNSELKRATERRSTAQAVFWGSVGLCTVLVVWDLLF